MTEVLEPPRCAVDQHRSEPVRMLRCRRTWLVTWGERQALVPDLVGMGYLARLVVRPGAELPAVELVAGGRSVPGTSRQPVLDRVAVGAYRERARQLLDQLAAARARADLAAVARLEDEAAALADELDRSTDVHGRVRGFTGADERARVAVRKAIKRAVDRIAEEDPVIGRELTAAVITGHTCRYLPAVAPRGTGHRPVR